MSNQDITTLVNDKGIKAIIKAVCNLFILFATVASTEPLQRSPRQKQYSVSCLLTTGVRVNMLIKNHNYKMFLFNEMVITY